MIVHLNIVVSGKVQGVFYRANTQLECQKLGICGFVRNESNGDVYIEAEGTQEQLDQLVKWCKIGPSKANVKEVVVTKGIIKEHSSFLIKDS